jgi:hypothetical protein
LGSDEEDEMGGRDAGRAVLDPKELGSLPQPPIAAEAVADHLLDGSRRAKGYFLYIATVSR